MLIFAAAVTLTTLSSVPPPPPTRRQGVLMDQVSKTDLMASVEKLESFGTRHTLSTTTDPNRGIGAARDWLKAEFERMAASKPTAPSSAGGAAKPRLTVTFEEFDAPKGPRLPDGAHLVNIVATLPGAQPEAADRRYSIVAHYDSRNGDAMDATGDAPGANDDASGCAVVLECARILSQADPLDATVVFLLTAGEEQGLIGAKYHADQAAARGEKILGVLNNDIVGDPSDPRNQTSKIWTVRVFSEGLPRNPSWEMLAALRAGAAESDSPSRQLARFVDGVAAAHEGHVPQCAMIFRQDRFMRGGDHVAFNDAGFPAVRFTVSRENYDRQHANVTTRDSLPYGDVSRYVNADYLADVTRLNLAAVMNLANAPRPPADVRIVTAALDNDTVLRWSPSPEPDVIGYEIVFRPTTDSQWSEQVFDADRKTEFTLKASKDDFFFGVRAVDRHGYRSPAAFAVPARE